MPDLPSDIVWPTMATQKITPPTDVVWPDVPSAPPDKPNKDEMPSTWEAIRQGLGSAWEQAKQSEQAVTGQKVETPPPETSPAAQPFALSDITSPGNILPKVGYQLAASSPALVGGIAGGTLGSAAGPWGTAAGGAMGAAAGAAFQEIGPSFAEELKKSPNDPDGAWQRAMEHAGTSGLFSGLGWSLFPARFFNGPVKNLAFQALGVQPTIAAGEQATQSYISGQPVTGRDLAQAYVQGAVGTAIPAAGTHLLAGIAPERVETPPAAGQPSRILDENAPPPDQPNPSKWADAPLLKQWNNLADGFKRTFTPELFSDLAREASGAVREFIGTKEQARDSIYYRNNQFHNWLERLPDQDKIDFMKAAAKEEGFQIPPKLMPAYKQFRNDLDKSYELDKDSNNKLGFINDYFPRQYKDPNGVQAWIASKMASGNKDFMKKRSFDLLQDALDAGFELKKMNPADLVTDRLIAGAEMRAKTDLMGKLEGMGAAVRITNPDNLAAYSKAGWRPVKDPVGNTFALSPDVQPLWQNAIDAKGMWDNDSGIGTAFRKWMGFKNGWVPIKLGLSLFHPLHVYGINIADSLTRGWSQLTHGDVLGAIGSTAKALYSPLQAAIPYMPHQGKAAREAWLTPEWEQTPEQKAAVKLMTEGGFSPQLSEQLRMQGSRNFMDGLANQDWLKVGKALPYEALRRFQGSIFEHWIPTLKTSAYLDEARSLLQRRPDLNDNESLRRVALGEIAKSVDNRFGEMFYSNLHWNRMLKDVGIGSFLSLGWNLGFAREFGGGLLEPMLRPMLDRTPTAQAVMDAKNKFTFSLIYAATSMLAAGMMTKALSGEWPQELMDYILPRIGGTNPDGSPRRLSTMFYTREVPMAVKHIQERGGDVPAGLGQMLWNKMMLEPLNEIVHNRDYYGYNIMYENSPWYQRYAQLGKYLLSDQLSPITITGAQRALQVSGQWDPNDSLLTKAEKIMGTTEGRLSMLGFGPAPSYASKSAAQNRLAYLFSEYVSPVERPMVEREVMEQKRDARQQLLRAKQNNDTAGIAAAANRLAELHMSSAQIRKVGTDTDLYLYQRLPHAIQASFLKELGKEDFLKYYPKSAKLTKGDEDVKALVRKYYGSR